jgi:hypothetical protein
MTKYGSILFYRKKLENAIDYGKKYLLIKNDSSKELYKRQRNLVNNKKKQAKEKFYANVNGNLSDLKTVKMQFLELESSRLVCPRGQYWVPCYFLYL